MKDNKEIAKDYSCSYLAFRENDWDLEDIQN